MRGFGRWLTTVGGAALLGSAALGQDVIDPVNKYSWGENIGFMNWRDASDGTAGVRIFGTYLSGYIWGENVGWITVGDGTPADGVRYGNTDGADAGVNVAPDGALSGLAWGENIGWINFSGGALATPAQPARIDSVDNRLRGYAWGENVGWINLDDANIFVGLACACELDGDPAQVDVFDLLAYLATWFAEEPAADIDGSPGVTVFDLLRYLECWFPASTGTPCP